MSIPPLSPQSQKHSQFAHKFQIVSHQKPAVLSTKLDLLWQIIVVNGVNLVNGYFTGSLKVKTFLAAGSGLGKLKRFMFAGGKETDLGWKIGLHLHSRAQINSLERTHVGTKVKHWSYLTPENTCLQYIPLHLKCLTLHHRKYFFPGTIYIVPKQFVRRNLFAVLLVGSNFVYLKHLHRTGNWSE